MQIPVDNRTLQQNHQVPDFIRKLYTMIEEDPEIISFSADGIEVHIHDYNKFVADLLPRYFRHRKWRSFIRQMNMYNFRKVNRGMKTYIFVNPIFRNGNQSNFSKIRRKINTRQEEQDAQTNLQTEMKLLNAVQTAHTYSLNTLPSLTGPLTTPNFLQRAPTYSNSILQFLSSTLVHRKKTEQICVQIKQNMQYITKQRKTTESKNIMNTVKDSMQMIDQVSNKFREKMEMYVDQHCGTVGDELSHCHQFNVMDFIGGMAGGYGANGITGVTGRNGGSFAEQGDRFGSRFQQDEFHKDSNNSQPQSYSMFNLLIPQPITTKPAPTPQPQKPQQPQPYTSNSPNSPNSPNSAPPNPQNPDQSPSPSPIISNSSPFSLPRLPNHSHTGNYLNLNTNHVNLLGLTPMCSFSSVTHLLNLEKE